jgi:Tfp pilus assembly protein PilF
MRVGMSHETALGMNARCGMGTVALVVALTAGVSAQRSPDEESDVARDEVKFGIAMAQHGLWHEAAFRFERARDLDPSYAEAFNNLAVAYEQLGRLAEARRMYERALLLEPGDAWIKENYRRFAAIDDRRVRPLASAALGVAAPAGGPRDNQGATP